METDSSVDYPDLLQVPVCVSANASNSPGKGRKHPFLQRSDSTLCLGCPPLDPFDTGISEALPLADQPHLLQPHSRREDLFGVPRQPLAGGTANPFEGLPTRLGLSARTADATAPTVAPTFSQVIQGPSGSSETRRSSITTSEPGCSKQTEKPNKFNNQSAGDGQTTLINNEQVDRAPIIVSPTIQNEATSSGKGKEISKTGRSVIVRAGTVSESSVNKVGAPEVLVVPTVEAQNGSGNSAGTEEVDPAATSQEISAHETVETSPTESARAVSTIGTNISHNILLGRWRLSLDLFGRVFMEDVGLEAGSVVSELGGFPVKEAKFRRDMEKLRNSQQKDITLSKVS